jgi:hypothetical protein
MAPSVPTMKYPNSWFPPPVPLDMYLEKSGILFESLSPLKGLVYDDGDASRRADDVLMAARAATALDDVVVAARRRAEDRATARVAVVRGAISWGGEASWYGTLGVGASGRDLRIQLGARCVGSSRIEIMS